MVVTVSIMDILYKCTNNAYSKTYYSFEHNGSAIYEHEQYVEDKFNKLHKDDGVTIKHTHARVKFRFNTEQHHTMFVLKYS